MLLDDLSPTHVQRPLPVPPSLRDSERIVDSLARIHAHWWNHLQLRTTIGKPLSQAEARASIARHEYTNAEQPTLFARAAVEKCTIETHRTQRNCGLCVLCASVVHPFLAVQQFAFSSTLKRTCGASAQRFAMG